MIDGKRKSGNAIISGKSQKKEFGTLSLSWACIIPYVFGVVHTFKKIWKERGLINI